MKEQIIGFFTPWIAYLVITLLHYLLPGKWMAGYIKDDKSGTPLQYRLNGKWVLITSILLWFVLGYLNWVPFDWLYTVRWSGLAGACTFGLLFSLWVVLPHNSTGKAWYADFYLGRLKNPQFRGGHIDAKMWLYLIGAVMLQLNVLGFVSHHFLSNGTIYPSVLLCAIMLTYFVWDYLTFEKVHLYTYDFIAERVGLKLGWGCLTFYPYFYMIALWTAIDLPNPELSVGQLFLFGLIFLSGWSIARGANMQKYFFKTAPEKAFLGILPSVLSDGNKSLLVNGFWGLSRHINYLGEILMGTGIALSVGYPSMFWVWLYPVYYVALLFPRQWSDDKICKAKYGALWEQYTQKVKYRIIPYIY